MSNAITVSGRLTKDPEVHFGAGGSANVNFDIAAERRFKRNDEWESQTSFFKCKAWGSLAENIGASLHKGDAVIAVGRMEQRSYETQDGEKRTIWEMVVDELGPALRWDTAEVTKNERRSER